jgi:serine/threonine-protein kinase RsbW
MDVMSEGSSTLHVSADLANLAEIRRFIEAAIIGTIRDRQEVWDVVQAVDEWATNIVTHGYGQQPGTIDLVVRQRGDALEIAIRDGAPVFDPTRVPEPDLTLPLERRPLGGMGIHLIRQIMDDLRHRPLQGGGNEVTLVKHLRPAQPDVDRARERTA